MGNEEKRGGFILHTRTKMKINKKEKILEELDLIVLDKNKKGVCEFLPINEEIKEYDTTKIDNKINSTIITAFAFISLEIIFIMLYATIKDIIFMKLSIMYMLLSVVSLFFILIFETYKKRKIDNHLTFKHKPYFEVEEGDKIKLLVIKQNDK